jgi:hypothetical protein
LAQGDLAAVEQGFGQGGLVLLCARHLLDLVQQPFGQRIEGPYQQEGDEGQYAAHQLALSALFVRRLKGGEQDRALLLQ